MGKRFLFFLCVCIIGFMFLTACWNYRDVENLGIVIGLAIDKTDDGRYLVTAELLDKKQSGKDMTIKTVLVETEGESIFDALRNAINVNSNRLYVGHTHSIIISEQVAREGIMEILDFLFRDTETRINIDLLISKSKSAKEVIAAKTPTSSLLSYDIYEMLKNNNVLSKAIITQVYEFGKAFGAEGISPIVSAICV